MTALPWFTAAIILALGLLHVAWAFGMTWPARDQQSLARAVVGRAADGRMPGALACLVVAALLALAALLVLAAAGSVGLGLPASLVRIGAYGVMLVFFTRGAVGLFAERLQPTVRGSRFARLNVLIYSPIALTLSAMILIALRH